MAEILPWQQQIWERLHETFQQQRIPHAMLLHGPAGTGKEIFARQLAQRLLCMQPTEAGSGCGRCHSCKLYLAGTHPDYMALQPEEGKHVLAVDQVRGMVEQFGFTAQIAGRKVLTLVPAESMNIFAANSLLKTLEEPPGEAVMLLVSHSPARLLPTIRSRCQQLAFPAPPHAESLAWLQSRLPPEITAEQADQLAEGAPLRALALSQPELLQHHQQMAEELVGLLQGAVDPIRVAHRWSDKRLEPLTTLRWLQQWVTHLIKEDGEGKLFDVLLQQCSRIDRRRLFRFYDRITEAISMAGTPINKELLFEEILYDWSHFR